VRLSPHTAQALLSNRSRVICQKLGSGGRREVSSFIAFWILACSSALASIEGIPVSDSNHSLTISALITL
jgi:hypothetical protein